MVLFERKMELWTRRRILVRCIIPTIYETDTTNHPWISIVDVISQ